MAPSDFNDENLQKVIASKSIPQLCEAIRWLQVDGQFQEQQQQKQQQQHCQQILQALHLVVQELMDGTYASIWTHDRRHRAKRPEEKEVTPKGFEVSSIAVVDEPELRRKYDLVKKDIVSKRRMSDVHTPWTARWAAGLDARSNEWLLMHGTTTSAAELIAQWGFSIQEARANGVCGAAIYFTESSTKADEYASTESPGEERLLILCRIVGGDVYYTEEAKPDKKTLATVLRSGTSNSVLNNREVCRQTFKEYVVTNVGQAIPECIVRYRQLL